MEDFIDALSFAKFPINAVNDRDYDKNGNPIALQPMPEFPNYSGLDTILVYDGTRLEFEISADRILNVQATERSITLTYVLEDGLFAFLKELKLRMQAYPKKMDIVLADLNGKKKKLYIETVVTYNGNFKVNFGVDELAQYVDVRFDATDIQFYHTTDEKKDFLIEA